MIRSFSSSPDFFALARVSKVFTRKLCCPLTTTFYKFSTACKPAAKFIQGLLQSGCCQDWGQARQVLQVGTVALSPKHPPGDQTPAAVSITIPTCVSDCGGSSVPEKQELCTPPPHPGLRRAWHRVNVIAANASQMICLFVYFF